MKAVGNKHVNAQMSLLPTEISSINFRVVFTGRLKFMHTDPSMKSSKQRDMHDDRKTHKHHLIKIQYYRLVELL
ncbi:hypothetical protein AQUCO_03000298v1 [Aquilegia coerulea]|uniref:Uncharacterized protein n=1 Tax=Aquilegia coerulea TaxID=218851 RepID=A0A2G5D2A4_AQUCA|nr:hypothetical protein AQUCO_03000298v1 [Aquilegia coerulea]